MERFSLYDQLLRSRAFAPSFTMITADKDDPRFDEFYRAGNIVRYFTGLFLTDMPSYYSLGFEVRNLHQQRGKNEEYTKLYVFQIHDDAETDKVTHGPFEWGENIEQFTKMLELRLFAETIWPQIDAKTAKWLLPPDATATNKLIAWTLAEDNSYVFVANLDAVQKVALDELPLEGYELAFATEPPTEASTITASSGQVYRKIN